MNAQQVLLTIILLPALLPGQDAPKLRLVRASATATVSAKPDRAQISIGVVTQAQAAQDAASANASQTERALAGIMKALGTAGEIKTTGYSLSPQMQYAEHQPPKISGYQASNTVLVEVNDLSVVGKVIDAANQSGANDINGITFSLKDDSAVRTQALAEAAAKARANAEAIARALNLEIVGVLQAEADTPPASFPARMQVFAKAASPQAQATPIETGDLDLQATVTVSLEVR
jgi:uncharacterized protein YggE